MGFSILAFGVGFWNFIDTQSGAGSFCKSTMSISSIIDWYDKNLLK